MTNEEFDKGVLEIFKSQSGLVHHESSAFSTEFHEGGILEEGTPGLVDESIKRLYEVGKLDHVTEEAEDIFHIQHPDEFDENGKFTKKSWIEEKTVPVVDPDTQEPIIYSHGYKIAT